MTKLKTSIIHYFTLFGSLGTLICCALPTLLVSLGLGAVLAGIASNYPTLIWISEHKTQVFIFSGLMILINGLLLFKNRNASCPVDPKLREACLTGRKTSFSFYIASVVIFSIGFFFAYLAPVL